jgi:hypothetical protein
VLSPSLLRIRKVQFASRKKSESWKAAAQIPNEGKEK